MEAPQLLICQARVPPARAVALPSSRALLPVRSVRARMYRQPSLNAVNFRTSLLFIP